MAQFVAMNTYYPQDPIVGSNNELQAYDWITIDRVNDINDLKNRIEKLEEGFRKIERKIEKEKNERVYDLMGRVRELNKYDNSVINGEVIGRVQLD